jgi:hypothetical protein
VRFVGVGDILDWCESAHCGLPQREIVFEGMEGGLRVWCAAP